MRLMDNLNELRGIQHIPGSTIVPTAATVEHALLKRSDQDDESNDDDSDDIDESDDDDSDDIDDDNDVDKVDEDDHNYTGDDYIDYAQQVVASQRTFELQENVIVERNDDDIPLDWEKDYDLKIEHTNTGKSATSDGSNDSEKKRKPGSARRANRNKKKQPQQDRRLPLLVSTI